MINWLMRRRKDSVIDTKIVPPRYVFTGHDDALRQRTEARRKAAEGLRTRANHVDSGEAVSNILRRVR